MYGPWPDSVPSVRVVLLSDLVARRRFDALHTPWSDFALRSPPGIPRRCEPGSGGAETVSDVEFYREARAWDDGEPVPLADLVREAAAERMAADVDRFYGGLLPPLPMGVRRARLTGAEGVAI